MNNRDRFFEAFAHHSHRVMGRVLQPFSLRHRFWLEAMDSPIVGGGTATMVDVEMASRICAIPFPLLDTHVPAMIERGPGWLARIGFCFRMLRTSTEAEYRLLQNYLMDHGCPPATHAAGVPTGPSGQRYETMPGILSLITALTRGSGWDPDKIWALSPGAAEWYLTGIFIHRGVDMKLKTAHDEEFEEGLRREREAAERGNVDAIS